jgi:predicted MFS family arabinose efflux permease
MRTLSPRGSFWTAASVAALALWGSGAPSMVYPLYAADFHLTPVVITTIFAVYPLSLVVVLIIFGSISDYIGRRTTMLIGVAALIVGSILFAIAPNVGLLFAGRLFQGIGVGLAMSPASEALVEFNSGPRSRAGSINTAATALGLAFATIVGGALVQYAPLPRELTFWVLTAVSVVVFVFVSFLPRHSADPTLGKWRPRGITVAPGIRGVWLTSSIAISAAFAVGAVLLSLGSKIAVDLINTDNALVSGSILALTPVVIGIVALAARRIPARTSISIGGLVTALALGLLIISSNTASLAVFLTTAIVAGVGYGLLFLGGLTLVNQFAPAHHRAQTLSAVYLVAYLLQGTTAVLVGYSATAVGLGIAIDIVAPILAGFALIASVIALLVGRARTVAVAHA